MRVYVPVLVRGKESEGVKFWGFGKQVYTELLGFISDPDYGDITDVKSGRDIVVEFTPAEGAGQYPKTAIRVKPNQTAETEDANLADIVVSGQKDIFVIFKKNSLFFKFYIFHANPFNYIIFGQCFSRCMHKKFKIIVHNFFSTICITFIYYFN